jgi:hypothetical protein
MLTSIEKILFVLAVLGSLYFAYVTFSRMVKIVFRGRGQLDFDGLLRRLLTGLVALINQGGIIRQRPITSLLHFFLAWGFIYYVLVNVVDIIEGYIPGFRFLGDSILGGFYRLLADVVSIAVLVGMIFFLVRRFVTRTPVLTYHNNVKLHPKAHRGVANDSLIVGWPWV